MGKMEKVRTPHQLREAARRVCDPAKVRFRLPGQPRQRPSRGKVWGRMISWAALSAARKPGRRESKFGARGESKTLELGGILGTGRGHGGGGATTQRRTLSLSRDYNYMNYKGRPSGGSIV